MTTELATVTDAPEMTMIGATQIQQTAMALVDAHKIATALCRTAFVPKHFQGKPDDAAAAILYGGAINMDPLTALQNVYVISGKPALYARAMVAVVMSKGHEVWTEEEAEGKVVVAGRRKGSDQIERVTWTSDMAKRAGYESNAKYKTDPRSMLYARASGDVARRIAPDALLGMAHNVEELSMERPRQVERPTAAAAFSTPEPEPSNTDEGKPEPITDKTRKHLFALFNAKGIGDDQQLAGINYRLGTSYESRSQLTEDDGKNLISYLDGLPDAADEPTLPVGGDA